MICYMPFSHLSEERLVGLVRLFGRMTIYQPAEFLLAGHMHRQRDEGGLDIRLPPNVDQDRLQTVFNEFTGWAGRLQSKGGDLAGIFKAMQGRLPMMEETNPSQIGTQIRHFGQEPGNPFPEALFQAALFMAMAHEYDAQQESLGRELGSIDALEKKMFDHLAGQTGEVDEELERFTFKPEPSQAEDAGVYMTEQRIQAWAVMAATDPHPPWVYLTPSRAVWESLGDRLPETILAARWTLTGTPPVLAAERLEIIETLAFSREPLNLPADQRPAGPQVELHVLPGCDPLTFCARLAQSGPPKPAALQQRIPVNTLIGLVEENE
jgi:hypothetical protein